MSYCTQRHSLGPYQAQRHLFCLHTLFPRTRKAFRDLHCGPGSSCPRPPTRLWPFSPQVLWFQLCEMAKQSCFPGSEHAACLRRKEQQIFINPSLRCQLKQPTEQSLTQSGPRPSMGPASLPPPTCTLTELG